MLKTAAAILINAALMFSAPAFAIDGQVLINQSTVMAAGGFPYKITQPGSYKLSGNLMVPASVDGIDILTDGVTIDLNGFRISGPTTCTASQGSLCGDYGIISTNNDVTIRNGSIVGFYGGANLGGSNNLIEEIHATGNKFCGIFADQALVRRNTIGLNGHCGIQATSSVVIENVVNGNQVAGMFAEGWVLYGSNTFLGNGLAVSDDSGPGDRNVSQNNNSCNGTAC